MKTVIRLITGLLLLGVLAALVYRWQHLDKSPSHELTEFKPAILRQAPGQPEIQPTEHPPDVLPAAPIEHPLTTPAASAPLPALEESDGALVDALAAVMDFATVTQWLEPSSIIRHCVVTIDNLPGTKVAIQNRLVKPVPGAFLVLEQNDELTVNPDNFARFKSITDLVTGIDPHKLVALYGHFYPLFQQAYADLGYPNKYFNDRLIEVIDHLLEAPDVAPPIALLQPKVMYRFADPALEQASAGHKILIRIGPENAGRMKVWLRVVRAALNGL